MIHKALEFLRLNVNRCIQMENADNGGNPSTDTFVCLNNICKIEEEIAELKDKIFLSLILTEEESALKNSSPYIARGAQVEIKNPPIFLNLDIIFTANYPDDYYLALDRLSQVIAYFQSNNFFTFSGNPLLETKPFELDSDEKNEIELRIEMIKLSLEEVNHLWGIVKTKSIPFVVYKVRLVKLEKERKLAGGGIIKEIELNVE